MITVANNSVVVINNLTSRRASVIARRTNSEAMGVIKAQMIDLPLSIRICNADVMSISI